MSANEIVRSTCASCGAALALECEPTPGFWGYRTYNEYFCPQCRKRNVVLSPGAVVTARLAAAAGLGRTGSGGSTTTNASNPPPQR